MYTENLMNRHNRNARAKDARPRLKSALQSSSGLFQTFERAFYRAQREHELKMITSM